MDFLLQFNLVIHNMNKQQWIKQRLHKFNFSLKNRDTIAKNKQTKNCWGTTNIIFPGA